MNRFSSPWLYQSEKNSWLFFLGFLPLELSVSAVQEQRSVPICVGPQLCGLRSRRMQLSVPFALCLLYQCGMPLSWQIITVFSICLTLESSQINFKSNFIHISLGVRMGSILLFYIEGKRCRPNDFPMATQLVCDRNATKTLFS